MNAPKSSLQEHSEVHTVKLLNSCLLWRVSTSAICDISRCTTQKNIILAKRDISISYLLLYVIDTDNSMALQYDKSFPCRTATWLEQAATI